MPVKFETLAAAVSTVTLSVLETTDVLPAASVARAVSELLPVLKLLTVAENCPLTGSAVVVPTKPALAETAES